MQTTHLGASEGCGLRTRVPVKGRPVRFWNFQVIPAPVLDSWWWFIQSQVEPVCAWWRLFLHSRYVHRRPMAAPAVLVEGPFTLRRGQEKPLISCSYLFWKGGCELRCFLCSCLVSRIRPRLRQWTQWTLRPLRVTSRLPRPCWMRVARLHLSVLGVLQPRYRPFDFGCRKAAHQAGDYQTFISSTNTFAEGTLLPACMDRSVKLTGNKGGVAVMQLLAKAGMRRTSRPSPRKAHACKKHAQAHGKLYARRRRGGLD